MVHLTIIEVNPEKCAERWSTWKIGSALAGVMPQTLTTTLPAPQPQQHPQHRPPAPKVQVEACFGKTPLSRFSTLVSVDLFLKSKSVSAVACVRH